MNTATQALSNVLSETYAIYLKTHNYHWNVEGIQFQQLHTMFEVQYREMQEATDELAERIRALGAYAPNGYTALFKDVKVGEARDGLSATEMLTDLKKSHEILINTLKEALIVIRTADDDVSEGMILDRMNIHEKTLWMIRSSLVS